MIHLSPTAVEPAAGVRRGVACPPGMHACLIAVQDGHQAQALTYRGPLHAVHTIYRQEGWRAFYNGLVPAWLGSGGLACHSLQDWVPATMLNPVTYRNLTVFEALLGCSTAAQELPGLPTLLCMRPSRAST
jgi:hypothetical protein